MNILEIAISEEDGVGNLAAALEVEPNVVSNWRYRGILPTPWEKLLRLKYAKAIKAAGQTQTFKRASGEVVTDQRKG